MIVVMTRKERVPWQLKFDASRGSQAVSYQLDINLSGITGSKRRTIQQFLQYSGLGELSFKHSGRWRGNEIEHVPGSVVCLVTHHSPASLGAHLLDTSDFTGLIF